jgi:multicomponent Na+:H+ antiporter subunit E
MNDAADTSWMNLRSALVRTGSFFCFWVIMAGTKPADLVVGLIAALIATAVSLRLLPARQGRLRPPLLARMTLRFLRQSVVAGFDVAWRALHPRLPLRPGFVVHESQLPVGPARDAFCTVTSLLPGTLPTDVTDTGGILIHCLDAGPPVAAQLRAEESLFNRALGGESRDG